jgi:class 3 adenylate cyclase
VVSRLTCDPAAEPTHTVVFADLCGSTGFMLDRSLTELRVMADELFFTAQAVASASGMTVIKYLGDGVMLLGHDAPAALDATLDLLPKLAAVTGLGASAGLATGRLVSHAGDLLGPAVNLASRLAELAAPGETLIDAEGWPHEPLAPARRVTPRGASGDRCVYVVCADGRP